MTAPDNIWVMHQSAIALERRPRYGNHVPYHHQRTVDELLSALESAADALADYSPLTGRTIETPASQAARALIAKHRKGC